MSPEGDIPMDGGDAQDIFPSGLPNGTINVESEDSDDDFGEDQDVGESEGHGGYQLLSQENESEYPQHQSTLPHAAAGESQVNLPSHLADLLPSQVSHPDLAARVSYSDTPAELESRRQAMAADEQIKNAMSGFTLPPTNIPPWANTLEEEEWKKVLLKKMNNETKSESEESRDRNPNR